MTWKKEAPTIEGWYWWRNGSEMNAFHLLRSEPNLTINGKRNVLLIQNMPPDEDGLKDTVPTYGEWFGPVEPPK